MLAYWKNIKLEIGAKDPIKRFTDFETRPKLFIHFTTEIICCKMIANSVSASMLKTTIVTRIEQSCGVEIIEQLEEERRFGHASMAHIFLVKIVCES